MGLLNDVAGAIWTYIQTLEPAVVRDRAEHIYTLLRPEITEITTQLETGTWQNDFVVMQVELPEQQSSEGRMRWGEEWVYPSEDLIRYVHGEFPYNLAADEPRRRKAHDNWRITLAVHIEAAGKHLCVAVPLTSLPWLEPRGQLRYLKRSAMHAGYPWRKKFERAHLEPSWQLHPQLGQREWYIQVSNETPREEILANLVIGVLAAGIFCRTGRPADCVAMGTPCHTGGSAPLRGGRYPAESQRDGREGISESRRAV